MKKIFAILAAFALLLGFAWIINDTVSPDQAIEITQPESSQESLDDASDKPTQSEDSQPQDASSLEEAAGPSAESLAEEVSTEASSDQPEDTGSNEGSSQELIVTDFPNTDLQDPFGNIVSLHSQLDKPTIINVWASWCPPCRQEMPYFQEQYDLHKDSINFIMLNATGSRPTETIEAANAYLRENDFSFPVYYDPQFNNQFQLGVNSLPSTYFIDQNGQYSRYIGMIPEATLKFIIQELLSPTP